MMKGSAERMKRVRALLTAALFLCSVAQAEVGVYDFGPGNPPQGPYILGIIDDIDPVGWRPFSFTPGKVVLNSDGETNGDGRPSMAFNMTSYLPIVTWARNSPAGFDVVVSHFENGAWSTPLALASSAADELDPFIAIDPDDGTVHVVYWIADASPRVMHRQAPPDLSSWSAPVQVTEVGQTGRRPAAVVHDGLLRVVYEGSPAGSSHSPRQMTLATGSGPTFTTEVIASSLYNDDNWPEVHSAGGRLWVEWIDAADQMVWSVRQLSGTWDSPSVVYFTSIEERDYHTRGRIKGLALE